MNSGTLAGSLIFAAVLVMLIAVLARLMMRGWRRRSERQAELLGDLPDVPEHVSSATVTTRGLYVGATLSPAWNERVTVGDLGYRSKAVLTRYPSGIMVERARAQPIWIPTESIAAIRMERGVAGKVVAGIGILAIRWRLRPAPRSMSGFGQTTATNTRSGWRNPFEQSRIGPRRRPGVHRQAVRRDRTSARGGRVFHRHVRLSGDADRSQLSPSDRGGHAPQIGNTGWNGEDSESRGERIWVAGYAVRDPSPRASNWRATGTLEDELIRQRIVGIAGIDTRAVVRHLRSRGSMKAGVFSDGALAEPADLIARVRAQQSMLGADLAGEVSTAEPYVVEPDGPPGVSRFTVAALDLGIKTNTPRNFARRGIRCHVLPASTTFEQIAELNPHGVFLSNGPGDPATADHVVALTREVLGAGIPLFGICFGNQILGRALGLSTYKMVFGHRGINIPVVDHATGRVAVTAQNHGFALQGEAGQSFATPFGPAVVSHTCANDGVVEGVKLVDGRAFSVQYHPEAAAGPHDAEYLFDQFVELMAGEGR